MKRETYPTAKAMSGRVAVMRCMSALTASRNGALTFVAELLDTNLELMSTGLVIALHSLMAKCFKMSSM